MEIRLENWRNCETNQGYGSKGTQEGEGGLCWREEGLVEKSSSSFSKPAAWKNDIQRYLKEIQEK